MKAESRQAQHMDALSRLLVPIHCLGSECFSAEDGTSSESSDQLERALRYTRSLGAAELSGFLALANTHHVIVRALEALQSTGSALNSASNSASNSVSNSALNNEPDFATQCDTALAVERSRIERAVGFLHSICSALQSRGCEVAVIKSLDHWPDLGSDLDLYTTSDSQQIEKVMREEFNAQPVERSWGDRLANKWNFSVPGLPELVEIHVQYLGQTGEHAELARRVTRRSVTKTVAGYDFRVAAPEERIVISTLQRVYRHFYYRLCDMIDTASLLQSGALNFGELKRAADSAGIWPGVATYLCLVENYIELYGGIVTLPAEVRKAAYSPDSTVYFQNGYLRVSKTTAVGLYSLQLLQGS